MPEILGVTNAVPGHESNTINRNQPNAPNSTTIQNVVDPSRVTRSDNRAEQQDARARSEVQRFDSNFQNFVQKLKESPDSVAVLSRLLAGRGGTVVSSGMAEGIAEDLARFLKMMNMTEAQFLRFLNSQFASGSRFGGPLFALLREAYRQADSEGLKGDILQFLKRFNDFSSTKHIEGNILRSLGQMAKSVPASWGNQLYEMMGQLKNILAAGDRAGALKLLQGKIIPFMGEYVERTHDLGRARGFLTMLTLDVARLENGSQENLIQAFNQLKNYLALRDRLSGLDDQALLSLLKTSSFAKASSENHFANQLADMADQALRGRGGAEVQSAFRDLVATFLVNESVYMTLNHLAIPMEWNGKAVFSEVWVDPDAEGGSRGQNEENVLRFLFKMDIQSLGFFDMVLTCQGKAVDLQIFCPEKLTPFTGIVETELKRILEANEFETVSVRMKKMEKPLEISQVFPKIFAGKDSINVKV